MTALRKMLNEDKRVTAPLVLDPVMAKGMDTPGFTAEAAGEIQKDMVETIGPENLLDVERRTDDEP
jgi:hypothetical protein